MWCAWDEIEPMNMFSTREDLAKALKWKTEFLKSIIRHASAWLSGWMNVRIRIEQTDKWMDWLKCIRFEVFSWSNSQFYLKSYRSFSHSNVTDISSIIFNFNIENTIFVYMLTIRICMYIFLCIYSDGLFHL